MIFVIFFLAFPFLSSLVSASLFSDIKDFFSDFYSRITGKTITGKALDIPEDINLTYLIGNRSEIVYKAPLYLCGPSMGGLYFCGDCTNVFRYGFTSPITLHWCTSEDIRTDRCTGESKTITLEDGSQVTIYSDLNVVRCNERGRGSFDGYKKIDFGEPWEKGFCLPQKIRVDWMDTPKRRIGSKHVTGGRWIFWPKSRQKKEIRTCEDLQNIRKDLDGYYVLANDINCSDSKSWKYQGNCTRDFTDRESCNSQIGCGWIGEKCESYTGFVPIGIEEGFGGYLDGMGHTITDLYINTTTNNGGLFGNGGGVFTYSWLIKKGEKYHNHRFNKPGYIKNLKLVNSKIFCGGKQSGDYCGTLVGKVTDGYMELSNIHIINGTVKSNEGWGIVGWDVVGGLIGMGAVFIRDSSFIGNISGGEMTGGLAGLVSPVGGIENSYFRGNIDSTGKDSYTGVYIAAGGLVGDLSGRIANSYAIGNIFGKVIGGIVGWLSSGSNSIENFYFVGNIKGKRTMGGIVGMSGGGWDRKKILNSYSVINFETDEDNANVGGLVGIAYGNNTIAFNSYWYDNATNWYGNAPHGIAGCSNCEKVGSPSYFLNKNYKVYTSNEPYWDFENIWQIDVNKNGGYPYLRWQEFEAEGLKCTEGQTRNCSLQEGVCRGSQEICQDNAWSGCNYSLVNGYEEVEVSCNDSLDNDCDGFADCEDKDCINNLICREITCEENWSCGNWTECNKTTLIQTRTCVDLNGCGTTFNKPNETQICCFDECQEGAKICSGKGYKTCGNYDDDSCFEWSSVTLCSQNQVCSNGNCILACNDECTLEGQKVCEGNGYKECGNYDDDSCLEWSSIISCGENETCSNGVCVNIQPDCVDDCSPSGAKRCISNEAYETCGNYDEDECLEWSSLTSCSGSELCVGGNCVKKVKNKTRNFFSFLNRSQGNYFLEINASLLSINRTHERILLKIENTKLLEIFANESVSGKINITDFSFKIGLIKNKSFFLINRKKDFGDIEKTIYLKVRNESGVCIKDEELEDINELLQGCEYIECPIKGRYNCSVLDGEFKISGLRHSALIASDLVCGDGICSSEESCLECPDDCGICPSSGGQQVSEGGSMGGGGGGGGSSGSIRGTDKKGITEISQFEQEESREAKESFVGTEKQQEPQRQERQLTLMDKITRYTKENKLYLIIISPIILALIIVLTLIILILKRKKAESVEAAGVKKDRIGKSELGRLKKQAVKKEAGEKNLGVEKIEEINKLLLQGQDYLNSGQIEEAKKNYEKIRNLFNSLIVKDERLYKKILEFYHKAYKKEI